MAEIHKLEEQSRFGSSFVAGVIIFAITTLIAGWIGFFLFLPIKSGMEVVTNLEEKFLPRAEGMVLNFVSLSEPSTIITSDNKILDELHDGLNRDPIALSDVPPFVVNTLLAAEDSNFYTHEGVDFIAIFKGGVHERVWELHIQAVLSYMGRWDYSGLGTLITSHLLEHRKPTN